MRIDEIEQENSDIDWFAVDRNGYIIHFASGGGVLPESVAASQKGLLELHQYFLMLPEVDLAVVVEPGLDTGLRWDSFLRYARRGLFSFDKSQLHQRYDHQYYLVARPTKPLMAADLPLPLANLLRCTQLLGTVKDLSILEMSSIT